MTQVLTHHVPAGDRAGARRRSLVARGTVAAIAVGMVAVALPASAGAAAPASAPNPDLRPGCGLDVVLMLDSSYSISNSPGGEDQVKGAAKSFLNALKDTSSRAGIVQFSTKVNVKRDVVPLTLVTSASTSGNGTHAAAINRYVTDGATNWQDAFINAKRLFDLSPRNVPKLAVLVTDGSPNTYNLTPTTAAPLVPDADPAALDPAIVAMNALKAEGVHTLAIGAGKVYTTDAKQQQFRAALQSVSGPDVYPDAAFDARTTDLVLEPDYQAVATKLRTLAGAICAGSLTVTSATTSASAPRTYRGNGSGWAVSTSVSPAGDWLKPTPGTGATRTVTTDGGGTALFQWTPSAAKTATVTFPGKKDYARERVACTSNGSPVSPAPVLSGGRFAVTVAVGTRVACTVYSRWTGPLASLVSVTPSTGTVTYGSGKVKLRIGLRSPIAPLAKRKVVLRSKAAGSHSWTKVGKFTTDARGTVVVPITLTSTHKFRAQYAGNSTQYPGTSRKAKVTVVPRVKVHLRTSTSGKHVMLRFTGKVSPNGAGKTVSLQQYKAQRWSTVTSTRLDGRSRYAISWRTKAATSTWRVLRPSDGQRAAGTSRTVVAHRVTDRIAHLFERC